MSRLDRYIVPVLTGLVFLPSAQLSYKFLGGVLSAAYLVGLALYLAATFRIERDERWGRWVKQHEHWLAIGWCITMITALAVLYPLAQGRYWGGVGSDRDDALMVGIEALLHLQYPYYERTYAGGTLSPMPGALFLGMPFHLIGSVVWQNVAYGFPCVFLAARCLSGWRTRWLLIPVLTTGNIGFIQDFVTGGDFVLAGIYLAVALILFADRIDRAPEKPMQLAATAALLGLAVCSRPIYPVALFMATAYAFRRMGPGQAALYGAVAFGVAGAITLPFFLYDPAAFLPEDLVNFFPPKWQWVQNIALPLLAVAIATLPALRHMDKWGLLGLLGICLAVVLLPGSLARMARGYQALYYWVPVALYTVMIILVRHPPANRIRHEADEAAPMASAAP